MIVTKKSQVAKKSQAVLFSCICAMDLQCWPEGKLSENRPEISHQHNTEKIRDTAIDCEKTSSKKTQPAENGTGKIAGPNPNPAPYLMDSCETGKPYSAQNATLTGKNALVVYL